MSKEQILTPSEVCQVLNLVGVDDTVYCVDEGVPGVDVRLAEVEGNADKALIYVAVAVEKRDGLYRITERLTLDEAVKRISVLLSMEVEAADCAC